MKEKLMEELTPLLSEVGVKIYDISFEKEGGRFAPVGDRLLVKFAEHDDAWEVCGLYTQELFKSYQSGSSFEEIMTEITDDLKRIKKADIYEKTKVIKDYEKTKPLKYAKTAKELFAEKNQNMPEEAPSPQGLGASAASQEKKS